MQPEMTDVQSALKTDYRKWLLQHDTPLTNKSINTVYSYSLALFIADNASGSDHPEISIQGAGQ